VSLLVHERDMLAVVGPNGGGKTTLLRLMLGQLKPHLGTVRVFGRAPERSRNRIGYVPQHLQFDPQFPISALDAVKMGRVERHLAGPYRRRDAEAARLALEQVDLADAANRAFAELSGGQRQRVLIARALVAGPELLLLDEPTANVDADVEARLYDLLHELNQRLTVVMVSHNLNVVTRHASHVACVNHTVGVQGVEDMGPEDLHEVWGTDLAVLHHNLTCRVNDPRETLKTPHLGLRDER
jgi:zinc transport system ATP-binding protein